MSQFSLYLDEDSQATGLAETLKRIGVDVLRSTEAQMDGRSDDEQLAFATAAGRVVYTANGRDYGRLHREILAAGRVHAGIIVWSRKRRYDIGEQARRIQRLWSARTAEEMAGNVEFLGQWGDERG